MTISKPFLTALVGVILQASALFASDLPNRGITPGAVDPAVTAENIDHTICAHTRPTWSKAHRPPRELTSRLKREQIKLYGYSDKDGRHYEEDHLVPISIGGLSYGEPQYANIAGKDAVNLWPQPRDTITRWSAEKKDELEYSLFKGVCAHEVPLHEAQEAFMTNWIKAYQIYSGLRAKYPSPFAGRIGE
jgi:hypothetical protein